jgi:hypothetical protein
MLSQGRGGTEWTTAHGDAQRSSWVRSDAKVSTASLQKPGGFQLEWKMKLHNETHQMNSLTQPVLLDRLVGFRGFKSIAVVGASADTMYAIDFDLGKPLWTFVLNYSADNEVPMSTWNCPGGLMAAATRPTAASISAAAGGGAGGRGGRSGGSVGEPGRGAPNLAEVSQRGDRGRGGGGGGGARGRGGQIMGLTDAFYAMGSDGYVHGLNVSNGADLFQPVRFIPENSKPSALLLVQQDFSQNGTPSAMLYTSTSGGCGGTPNGVWAVDLASKEPAPIEWKTDGGNIAGSAGPTLGSKGLLFAAVGKGTGGHSDSVVALDAKTLELKDWITVHGADFNSSPIIFPYKGRDLLAVAGNDGKLYLLDGGSLGGANHSTPLYVTPKFSAPTENNALATWETGSTSGTRWVLAPFSGAIPASFKVTANGVAPNGGVLAFKLAEQDGKIELQAAWASRNMISPLGPLVVNNVVFALSSGEYHGGAAALQRAQRSVPAVLYALDGATGKELWSSGKQITSFARSGLAAGGTNGSTVFVATYDNTLYAFGFPLEK